MSDTVTAADLFTRWDIPWGVTCALLLAALIYVRGWLQIHRTRPEQFPRWRLECFLGGLLALFVAVASPLDTFSESLLFMHMAQHWVLMSIAPPLIVFGAPVVPMLRGLPRWVVRRPMRPLFKTRALHAIGGFLTEPRVAWLAMNGAYLCWHIPRAYEFALSSEFRHNCEHACFFFTNLMFWWVVIQPWPSRQRYNRWLLIPYLGLAEVVNTGISACLCFCGRLLYPSYAEVPRLFGISALNDQVTAGAFMWICGTMVYAIAGVVVIAELLSSGSRQREPEPAGAEEIWWTPAPPVK
jgi:putative membrane protein